MLLNNACEMTNRAIAFSNTSAERHKNDLNVLQQPINIEAKFSGSEFINVIMQLGTIVVDHPATSQQETSPTLSPLVNNYILCLGICKHIYSYVLETSVAVNFALNQPQIYGKKLVKATKY